MMLSEVLRRFFVLPLGQSELVDRSTEDDPEYGQVIVLTWADSYTGLYHRQEFVDQGVGLDGELGLFTVTTIDGHLVAFFALDRVDLTGGA